MVTVYNASSGSLYNLEGYNKIHDYPPPYWYNNNWYYATPWLWLDGSNKPKWIYSGWESYVINRMAIPSQLEIFMDGAYDQNTYQGSVDIAIYNDDNSTLNRTLYCYLTESDIYYSAPNGLQYHNHVCRDMIPNDNGTAITLNPYDTTYVNLNFTLNAAWDYTKCELVCFVQHDSLLADSTKDIMQGAKVEIASLGVEEPITGIIPAYFDIAVNYSSPRHITISYTLPYSTNLSYQLVDLSGRTILSENLGVQETGLHQLNINANDLDQTSGTIFFILKTDHQSATEKLILL